MQNATELTLTTKAVADTGAARLYVGSLTEVVLWRDSRTNRMVHAQPGDYIVQDSDGYPRRYSADDFAALFEAAPVPAGVTNAASASITSTTATITWTDNSADKVNIYKDGVFHSQVNHGVQTKAITGLVADTVYSFTLKTVNGYGVESTAATVAIHALPAAPTTLALTVLGQTSIALTWVNISTTAGIAIYRKDSGSYAKVGSTLAAGTTHFNDTALVLNTAYTYTVRHVSAVDAVESANSNEPVATTADVPANVTALATASITATGLTLNWTKNAAGDGAKIYQDGVFLASVAAGVQTEAVTGLTTGTFYEFIVRSVNLLGQEATGVEVSATTS